MTLRDGGAGMRPAPPPVAWHTEAGPDTHERLEAADAGKGFPLPPAGCRCCAEEGRFPDLAEAAAKPGVGETRTGAWLEGRGKEGVPRGEDGAWDTPWPACRNGVQARSGGGNGPPSSMRREPACAGGYRPVSSFLRSMPIFSSLAMRVVGLRPSRAAAPLAPKILPLQRRTALRMLSFSSRFKSSMV